MIRGLEKQHQQQQPAAWSDTWCLWAQGRQVFQASTPSLIKGIWATAYLEAFAKSGCQRIILFYFILFYQKQCSIWLRILSQIIIHYNNRKTFIKLKPVAKRLHKNNYIHIYKITLKNNAMKHRNNMIICLIFVLWLNFLIKRILLMSPYLIQ